MVLELSIRLSSISLQIAKPVKCKDFFFRKRHPEDVSMGNEFSKVIFGGGPVDLSELKKRTDQRRREVAEKTAKLQFEEALQQQKQDAAAKKEEETKA